jgi:hypothetical protein
MTTMPAARCEGKIKQEWLCDAIQSHESLLEDELAVAPSREDCGGGDPGIVAKSDGNSQKIAWEKYRGRFAKQERVSGA